MQHLVQLGDVSLSLVESLERRQGVAKARKLLERLVGRRWVIPEIRLRREFLEFRYLSQELRLVKDDLG